jgi:hypothetical protein
VNERACKRCGWLTWSSRSPYCLEHRPPAEVRAKWATKTRDRRGYGTAHKRLRERYRHLIDGGAVVLCARCRRRILPGESWDLDHGPDRSSYLGASHRMCNQVAGARKGAAVTNSQRQAQKASAGPGYVRTWSRVWSWPTPPDVYVDTQVVRAYLEEATCGRGEI